MFWGIILEPGKKYTSVVEDAFHLSTATLDVKSVKNDSITSVKLQFEGQNMILCNLAKPHTMQCSLDLVFPKEAELTFSTDGDAVVHLTGYVITPDESIFTDESDVSESEVENIPNKSVKGASKVSLNAKAKGDSKPTQKNLLKNKSPEKRSQEQNSNVPKKKVKTMDLSNENIMDSSDDEDTSDTESGSDNDDYSKCDFIGDDIEDEDDSDLEEEDDTDEDDSDEDDSDDEDEMDSDLSSSDEVPSKLQTPKTNKNQNQKTPIQDKKTPKTPTSNKKQDGKQNKERQSLANGATPKSEKKDKNKTPKSENKSKANESASGTPGTPLAQKKQTLEGGVITEELKAGNGPVAKPGRMVTVYYVGRLKHSNRVFDQSTSGKGFSFRLGRSEVIKGWDVGLSGMKVGSKRRITCPAPMAYGSKGSPPNIPPNSTLIFEVELKSVN